MNSSIKAPIDSLYFVVNKGLYLSSEAYRQRVDYIRTLMGLDPDTGSHSTPSKTRRELTAKQHEKSADPNQCKMAF